MTARTRTFTWEDPAAVAAGASGRTGLEFVRAMAARELPAPPIAQAFGMEGVEVREGRAVFALTPAEWMYNPIGSVHGGVAATLLDQCMGAAIQTTLPAGTGYATSDLHVRYLRAMSASTGRVRAEGTVTHAGRRQATAEGRLVAEETGTLLATATTGCLVLAAP